MSSLLYAPVVLNPEKELLARRLSRLQKLSGILGKK
jgi:hypothetical protein